MKKRRNNYNFFIFLLVGLLFFILSFGSRHAQASVFTDKKALVVLKEENQNEMQKITKIIQGDNGKISHQFENKALIFDFNKDLFPILSTEKEISGIFTSQVSEEEIKKYSQDFTLIFNIWNKSFEQGVKIDGKDPGPVLNDALKLPEKDNQKTWGGESKLPGEAPYGSGFYDTSEFMAGKVSITLILPESNGAYDASTENWDASREIQVLSEVQSAMNWWYERAKAKGVDLSFIYHIYSGRTDSRAQTSYEPINRSSFTGSVEQGFWISEIMNNFGYSSSDYFYNSLSFINKVRSDDGSDWSFIVFVADSKNDPDGKFTDDKFAYAYYGGPFMVMTYDNDVYGIDNMEAAAAHELGHTFYALDQYYSAGQDCSNKAGYLAIENQNSEYSQSGSGCLSNASSVMRGGISPYQEKAIDQYATTQVGWKDSDQDEILDIFDAVPTISITEKSTNNNLYTIKGKVNVGTITNRNPYVSSLHEYYNQKGSNITLNKISKIWYRVDSGNWQEISSVDGAFDEGEENFSFTVSSQNNGSKIEIKTQDNLGNLATSSTDANYETPIIVTGAGPTGGPQVRIFSPSGNSTKSFFAYAGNVRSGVNVAIGDVDGDKVEEIVTGPGNNAGPHIRIFKKDGTLKYPGFFAYNKNFRGGVNIALGDLDGDGKDEIIAGSGVGGGPQVRVFDARGNQKVTAGFFAYDKNFRGGVNVAAGDIDGDNKDEIITGAGKGGGPQVRFFEGNGSLKPIQFFAFHPNFHGGVNVASGDVNGDKKDEIIISQASEGEAWVKVYKYNNEKTVLGEFNAYGSGVKFGTHITAGDVDLDGKAEIITGAGYGGGPQVRIFEASGKLVNSGFFAYGRGFRGGVFVGGE